MPSSAPKTPEQLARARAERAANRRAAAADEALPYPNPWDTTLDPTKVALSASGESTTVTPRVASR